MSPRLTLATAARVLAQLRRDPRTMALIVVVPCLLLLLRDGRLLAQATPSELRALTGVDDLDGAFLRLVEEAA